MNPKVVLVRFGPNCGELTCGYNLFSVEELTELSAEVDISMLVISGHVPRGLGAELRWHVESLGSPTVIALPPCHSTRAFWDAIDHRPADEVVEVHETIAGCLQERPTLIDEVVRLADMPERLSIG